MLYPNLESDLQKLKKKIPKKPKKQKISFFLTQIRPVA
jgi:hypothetical protein